MMEPPVHTPATPSKTLQLTPIWEQVLRTHRVPPGVGVGDVLREIRSRLQDGEWEVRQHALRVLVDVLSVAGPLNDPVDLQVSLVTNLGSPAPGVRKAARDALSQLLKHNHNPEDALLSIISTFDEENIVLGIVVALSDLVRPFILPENGGYVLRNPALRSILTFLVNKVPIPIFQEASVSTLHKIKDMCGEKRFLDCLAHISPDPQTMQLFTLNLDDSGIELPLSLSSPMKTDASWTDNSDNEEIVKSTVPNSHQFRYRIGSSEDVPSDASDDTFTMESAENGRLLLETEIKISEERAITMRIMEDDTIDLNSGCEGRFVSADGALVMAVMPSSDEDIERRSLRRVRFGGEVVKLCTPDSDATDVRIEIENKSEADDTKKLVLASVKPTSHIPLPVSPATSLPNDSKRRQSISHEGNIRSLVENISQEVKIPSIEIDVVEDVPPPIDTPGEKSSSYSSSITNYSTVNTCAVPATPSSESNETKKVKYEEFSGNLSQNHTDTERAGSTDIWFWETLNLVTIDDMATLKNNHNWKEEQACLEKLSRTLNTEAVKEKLQNGNQEMIISLFRFLIENTKLQNVETSLGIIGQLLQILPYRLCQASLPELVPGLCRYAGGLSSVSIKILTSSILRLLISRQSSQDILHTLLGDRCLHASSSKIRENSVLVLMQVLMTSPSTNVPLQVVLDEVCRRVTDSRRRVRHAALEALSLLAHFLTNKHILESASKFGDNEMLEAVSCRLGRRMTPSVTPDGLVLYALQIPSSRRLAHTGPPHGPDVDWILAGKGSLSTGSARSRGQVQAAQASRWVNDNNGLPKSPADNPWTAQKQRYDKTNHNSSTINYEEANYVDTNDRPGNGVRPYYLRVNGAEDVRSQLYALHGVAGAGGIRVLTPSALRKNPESKSPWTDTRNRDTETIELKRLGRITARKAPETHPHAETLSTISPIHHISSPPAALFLPSIDSPERFRQPSGRYHETPRNETLLASADKPRFVEPVVTSKLTETTPQPLSQPLPGVAKPSDAAATRQPLAQLNNFSSDNDPEELIYRVRGRECKETVPADAAAASEVASVLTDRQSSTSSTTSGSSSSLLPPPDKSAKPHELPYKALNESFNQKVKTKRKFANGTGGKVAPTGVQFPDTLKAYERPKDGLDTCFTQLNAPQWEVTMQGLTSLVRLVRHHPDIVASHIHALVAALARQIRNLRSQVSRAACVVAAEMFITLKRTLEPELEELAGALFHKVADTNKFIRQDSNDALDAMVDSLPPQKTIPVVLLRGGTHPNAIVRTAVARLFLRIVERIGTDRVLALPKDIRDKLLLAGAGLLTEGRQETRSFAKQLFRVWTAHPGFNNVMLEVIPTNVLRRISKTLAALRT